MANTKKLTADDAKILNEKLDRLQAAVDGLAVNLATQVKPHDIGNPLTEKAPLVPEMLSAGKIEIPSAIVAPSLPPAAVGISHAVNATNLPLTAVASNLPPTLQPPSTEKRKCQTFPCSSVDTKPYDRPTGRLWLCDAHKF